MIKDVGTMSRLFWKVKRVYVGKASLLLIIISSELPDYQSCIPARRGENVYPSD